MVVVLYEAIDPAIERVARKYQLPVLMGFSARQVLPAVLGSRATVVVVQLATPAEQVMEFIRGVQRSGRRLVLIAAACEPSERLEAAARCSGVTCYLSLEDGAAQLERVLQAYGFGWEARPKAEVVSRRAEPRLRLVSG